MIFKEILQKSNLKKNKGGPYHPPQQIVLADPPAEVSEIAPPKQKV